MPATIGTLQDRAKLIAARDNDLDVSLFRLALIHALESFRGQPIPGLEGKEPVVTVASGEAISLTGTARFVTKAKGREAGSTDKWRALTVKNEALSCYADLHEDETYGTPVELAVLGTSAYLLPRPSESWEVLLYSMGDPMLDDAGAEIDEGTSNSNSNPLIRDHAGLVLYRLMTHYYLLGGSEPQRMSEFGAAAEQMLEPYGQERQSRTGTVHVMGTVEPDGQPMMDRSYLYGRIQPEDI